MIEKVRDGRDVRRASLWARALRTAAVVLVVAAAYALIVEPQLVLTTSRLELPPGHGGRLVRCLDGARIVHLSDLHARGMGLRERRVARRLAELNPDLLLMTGDYGEGAAGMEALATILGAVRPRLGAFGVYGNNDHFRGQARTVARTLAAAGVTLLVNSSATIAGSGCNVTIVGVDDPFFGRDDLERAMEDVPEGAPVILLAHAPELLKGGRSRALLVNAGDVAGPWGRGWFWQDGSHMREEAPIVSFETRGRHRVRVQRREDGVAVKELRLVPGGDDAPGDRGAGRSPGAVPGTIVIDAAQVADQDVHGSWVREETEEATVLADLPDRGGRQASAEAQPDSYFEAEFEAESEVDYHVWVRLYSRNGRGTSDSLYLQFDDGLNAGGEPDYRIGEPLAGVDPEVVDLMLAGHTHGGQVALPWLGPVEPNVRSEIYRQGRYDFGGMTVYVSRGIGWSWMPLRFWAPPEIVLFESSRRKN